jgi:HSP20 family protein
MNLVRYTHPTLRSLAPSINTFRRSPWTGFENEIDRFFASALTDLGVASSPRFPVDVYEDKDNIYVRSELPGVKRDELNVEIVDGELTIEAVRNETPENGQSESSSFRRTLTIAQEVQADKVAAAYENGVLTVTLPKAEAAKPKKINVSVK